MNHQDAVETNQVEKYLLAELSTSERDEFETHFFDCEACADDLRLSDQFLQHVRVELRERPGRKSVPESRGRLLKFFSPAWIVPALAAMLLVIAYQNAFVYPGLKREVASLSRPEVLPTLPLVNGTSRGGEVPSFSVDRSGAFLLSVDIPSQDVFSSYLCSLYSPSGSLLWRQEVSSEQARNSVSIRVIARPEMEGLNLLLVQGVGGLGTRKAPVDIVRYRYQLQVKQ